MNRLDFALPFPFGQPRAAVVSTEKRDVPLEIACGHEIVVGRMYKFCSPVDERKGIISKLCFIMFLKLLPSNTCENSKKFCM